MLKMNTSSPRRTGTGLSRRQFMAATTGALLGLLSVDTLHAGKSPEASAIVFPEVKCGTPRDSEKRLLIAYASKYGSTGGIAQAIGEKLCSMGMSVDVSPIGKIHDMKGYRGAVIGSAVYRGEWMPEAVTFLKANSQTLRGMPVAYFQVCMALSEPTKENREKALSYFDTVYHAVPDIKPVISAAFAGALHYKNLLWPYKMVLKFKGATEGDFRDWKAVAAWAEGQAFKALRP